MKTSKAVALSLAALVLGLVGGNVGVGFAAGSVTTDSPNAGLGLRMGAAMRDAGARLADVVGKLTNTSSEDVIEQRQAGTSFASIAEKNGVSAAQVVSEALKVREDILAQRVAAGTITQEQADDALSAMKTRLEERVSATDESCTGAGGGAGCGAGGAGGACGGAGGGAGGGRGRGGAGCGGACTQGTVAQ